MFLPKEKIKTRENLEKINKSIINYNSKDQLSDNAKKIL